MQGKTHLAVGTAAALAIMQPRTMVDLFVGIGAAMIGSVICDIDVGTSESYQKAGRIIAFCFTLIGMMAGIEWKWNIGIVQQIMCDNSTARIAISAFIFLCLCAFGKDQPHRTFMHSFLVCALLTVCIYNIVALAAHYFVIGFISHLAIDFLNHKGLQLFYPLKFRFSLHLCSATGLADQTMRRTGTMTALALFIYYFYAIGNSSKI